MLLIDCGGDAHRSLARQGWTALDITDIYISHLHADHIGGLEWLGIVSYFARSRDDPSLKPRLHIRQTLVEDLWLSLHGGNADDDADTIEILGPEHEESLIGGDEIAARENRKRAGAAATEKSSLPAEADSSCLSFARQFPKRFSGSPCSSQYSR